MDDPASTWVLMLVLLGLSAFFSASEAALMSAGRLRIRHLVERGDHRAQLVEKLRHDPNRLLGSLLVGNNLVNVAFTSLATAVSLRVFGAAGLGIAMIGTTALILFFAEILPKTAAAYDPEATSLIIARPISLIVKALRPLAWGFTVLTWGVLRVMGRKAVKTQIVTAEEFKTLVGDVEHHGILDSEGRAMIEGVFQFSGTTVAETMTPRPDIFAVSADMRVDEASQLVLDAHFSRLPVYQGTLDSIIGFVHVKDIVKAVQAGTEETVHGFVRPVIFAPETRKVNDLFTDMRRDGVHMAIILDEYGSTSGLVTMEDLIEEIVGDISDEHDSTEQPIALISEGVYLVQGRVLLEELAEATEFDLAEEDVDTVGGYVFHRIGHIPKVGDEVETDDLTITVEEMRGKRVCKVRIERALKDDEAANPG